MSGPTVLPGKTRFGSSWFRWYWRADVRLQIQCDLQAIAEAGFSHIAWIASLPEFSWPLPTDDDIARFRLFLGDIYDRGLKLILICGPSGGMFDPALIPATETYWRPLSGHRAGETVIGNFLFWDIPVYDSTVVEKAKLWWEAICAACAPDRVEYVALGGGEHTPWGGEIGPLFDEYPYLEAIKASLAAWVPWLNAHSPVPVGVNLQISLWKSGGARLDQVRNLLAAVPASTLPVLDFTTNESVALGDVAALFPAAKIVASDWQLYEQIEPDPATARALADRAASAGTKGWWAWAYREDPSQQDSGYRRLGYVGPTGGWLPAAAAALKGAPSQVRGLFFNPEVVQA